MTRDQVLLSIRAFKDCLKDKYPLGFVQHEQPHKRLITLKSDGRPVQQFEYDDNSPEEDIIQEEKIGALI